MPLTQMHLLDHYDTYLRFNTQYDLPANNANRKVTGHSMRITSEGLLRMIGVDRPTTVRIFRTDPELPAAERPLVFALDGVELPFAAEMVGAIHVDDGFQAQIKRSTIIDLGLDCSTREYLHFFVTRENTPPSGKYAVAFPVVGDGNPIRPVPNKNRARRLIEQQANRSHEHPVPQSDAPATAAITVTAMTPGTVATRSGCSVKMAETIYEAACAVAKSDDQSAEAFCAALAASHILEAKTMVRIACAVLKINPTMLIAWMDGKVHRVRSDSEGRLTLKKYGLRPHTEYYVAANEGGGWTVDAA